MGHDSYMWDMTHSYVSHDSCLLYFATIGVWCTVGVESEAFLGKTLLRHTHTSGYFALPILHSPYTRDMTQRHDSFICVT